MSQALYLPLIMGPHDLCLGSGTGPSIPGSHGYTATIYTGKSITLRRFSTDTADVLFGLNLREASWDAPVYPSFFQGAAPNPPADGGPVLAKTAGAVWGFPSLKA